MDRPTAVIVEIHMSPKIIQVSVEQKCVVLAPVHILIIGPMLNQTKLIM